MIDLVLSIIQTIFSWLITTLSLSGIGLWLLKLIKKESDIDSDSLFDSFWLGLCAVIFFLHIWHLFFKIDLIAMVLVIVSGISGLVFFRKQIAKSTRFDPKEKRFMLVTTILAVFSIVIADRIMGEFFEADTGYFVLPTIKWYINYPVIPGLGNLQSGLAFNQATTLIQALFEQCPGFIARFRASNGIFILVLIAQFLIHATRNCDTRNYRLKTNFQGILLVFLVIQCFQGFINAAAPEIILHCVCIAIAQKLFDLFVNENEKINTYYVFIFTVFLSATLITIKLSMAIYAIIAVIVSWYHLPDKNKFQSLLPASCISLLIFIPWLIHGVILSGYLIFPVKYTGLPFDWTVPPESIETRSLWIQGWSRRNWMHFARVIGNGEWFIPWLETNSVMYLSDFTMPFYSSVIALFVIIRNRKRVFKPLLYLAWIAALGMMPIYWMAPEPSYCGGLAWVMTAALVSVAFDVLQVKRAWFIAVILLPACLVGQLSHTIKNGAFPLTKIVPVKKLEFEKFTTRSGLDVYIPIGNDQAWEAKLPSTPYPNPFLRLRKKGDLKSGFVSDIKGGGVGTNP